MGLPAFCVLRREKTSRSAVSAGGAGGTADRLRLPPGLGKGEASAPLLKGKIWRPGLRSGRRDKKSPIFSSVGQIGAFFFA